MTPLPPLRLAIEGCYPSFPATDLVMRILGVLCTYTIVSRVESHDLLIRGPFSDGSGKRRWVNRGLRWQQTFCGHSRPVTLHVSSENPVSENYQGFDQSGCDFGLGHEIRVGDPRYLRMPHWWNYVDFTEQGVPSPERWVRLGEPMRQEQLLKPLAFNRHGHQRAAFVASYLNGQRRFLMDEVCKVLPVDGFGRAFDASITDHTRSGFTKRDLLSQYQYCFCPENAIAPGYYTEKIPESFVCGSIPIAYSDPHVSVDFNPKAFLNAYDYLKGGIALGLAHDLSTARRMSELTSVPLLRERVCLDSLLDFMRRVIVASKSC